MLFSVYVDLHIPYRVADMLTMQCTVIVGDDGGEHLEEDAKIAEEDDEEFPIKKLESLEEQLGRPKWVVPVRPKDELEMLLRAAIKMVKAG